MSFAARNWAWDCDLPCPTKWVLFVLADFHNEETGQCNPSLRKIAQRVGLSTRSVDRHLVTLQDQGFIAISEGTRTDGSRTSNQYHLAIGHANTSCAIDNMAMAHADMSRHEPVIEPVKEPGNLKSVTDVPDLRAHGQSGGKKSKGQPDPRVAETMQAVEYERGYVSTRYSAEASAVKAMLGMGYSPDDIMGCYRDMKRDPFWQGKALAMMTVRGQIGEWRNRPASPPSSPPPRKPGPFDKYGLPKPQPAGNPFARYS